MLAADNDGRTTVYLGSKAQCANLIAIRLPEGVEEGPPNRVAWLPPNSASDSYRLGLVQLLIGNRSQVDFGIMIRGRRWMPLQTAVMFHSWICFLGVILRLIMKTLEFGS